MDMYAGFQFDTIVMLLEPSWAPSFLNSIYFMPEKAASHEQHFEFHDCRYIPLKSSLRDYFRVLINHQSARAVQLALAQAFGTSAYGCYAKLWARLDSFIQSITD